MWFWILGSVLDSGKCLWILGRVLDSGKCFGFWDVFWILGRVLDSGKCLVLMSHRSIEFKLFFVNYGNS